jgi:hypothetical protein
MDDMKPKDPRSALAAHLFELMEDEAEADNGYFKFLAMHKPYLSSKQVATIQEIIGDEMNHIELLMSMATEITKVKPATDGVEED